MGKRKHKTDLDYIENKIKKLQQKLEGLSEVSESEPLSPPLAEDKEMEEVENISDADKTQLPEEFLLALGKEGEEVSEIGPPIRPELAARWTKIIEEGLKDESREALANKYPTPSNFKMAAAPLMNAEIMASLSDTAVNRDNRIVHRQHQIGKLMICLGRSLTDIMTGNINNKKLIEEINDAAKIAADLSFQDSASRKFFAMSGATKAVREDGKKSKTDEFLFGKDWAYRKKSAQTVFKTEPEIKDKKKPLPIKTLENWEGPSQYQQKHQKRARSDHQLQQMNYFKKNNPEQPQRTQQKRPPPQWKYYC